MEDQRQGTRGRAGSLTGTQHGGHRHLCGCELSNLLCKQHTILPATENDSNEHREMNRMKRMLTASLAHAGTVVNDLRMMSRSCELDGADERTESTRTSAATSSSMLAD